MQPGWERWRACLDSGADEVSARAEFQALVARYGDKHRAYHNLDHITVCLTHLDAVRERLLDPIAVELAVWYHDAIYKPSSGTNEEDSAALAASALARLRQPPELGKHVERLVLVTKHPSIPADDDERYLVDIDLAILGAAEEAFAAYEKQIRQEYRWVPAFVYRRERAKVLRAFLALPAIYHTAHFQERFEATARRNLESALGALGG